VNVELYNTLMIGFSFFCVFLAFNTTQNLQTTLNQNQGRISLGIIYGCCALTGFFSGFIDRKLGNRPSLIIGGATYVFYIASNIHTPLNIPLYYTASAIIGIGASLLWTSQGSFLSRQSRPETFGFYGGLFWGLFQANGIIGNLIAQLTLQTAGSSFLFFLFTIIASGGVLLMLLLVYPPIACALETIGDSEQDSLVHLQHDTNATEHAAPDDSWEATFRLLTGTLRIFADPTMAHLIPLMIFSGLSQSYFYGGLPPLFSERYVGWGMMTLACTDVIGSVVMGRLSDWIGRRLVLLIGAFFTFLGAALANFGNDTTYLYLLFLASACFGLSDACYNTQIYSLIRHFCDTDDRAALGFGFYRLIQAASSAAAFFYSIPLGFLEQTTLVLGFLVLGLIFVGYLHYFIASVESESSR
jgi:MFS family permease